MRDSYKGNDLAQGAVLHLQGHTSMVNKVAEML